MVDSCLELLGCMCYVGCLIVCCFVLVRVARLVTWLILLLVCGMVGFCVCNCRTASLVNSVGMFASLYFVVCYDCLLGIVGVGYVYVLLVAGLCGCLPVVGVVCALVASFLVVGFGLPIDCAVWLYCVVLAYCCGCFAVDLLWF